MAHVQMLNYTSPQYHKKLIKEVGQWKYPVIGPIRKGWYRPYHAEMYYDDFRIPDIVKAQFVKDLNCHSLDHLSKRKDTKSRLITIGLRLLQKFGPWKDIKDLPDKQVYGYAGWKYTLLVGSIQDPRQKSQYSNHVKEVL